MPKDVVRLTEKELNELKYVSMADFSKRIDKYDDINDKLKFATQYLVLHSSNGDADCSLDDAINIARMKIADAAYELKEQAKMLEEKQSSDDELEIVRNINKNKYSVNPLVSEEKDLELELFMGHPDEYLRTFALKRFNEIEKQSIQLQAETKFKENCMTFYNNARNIENLDLNVQARRTLHVNNRLEAMFGGKAALEKAYRDTQPGFFSKMFSTSSIASKNLDTVYKAFNDPKHALYGDLNAMKQAAGDYLTHKIPNWKPGDPYPNEAALNKLDATGKARTIFSIAVLQAMDKETKNEKYYYTIVKGCASQDHLQQKLDELSSKSQDEFRQKLVNDLKDELEEQGLDNVVDRNSIIERTNQNQVQNMDESVLDKSTQED